MGLISATSLRLSSVQYRQPKPITYRGLVARRVDGNSLVLTLANARPHDLYFFAEPEEMFRWGCSRLVSLNAPAVLERQLAAFCFDKWVAAHGAAAVLLPTVRSVFSFLSCDDGEFPYTFLNFVEGHQVTALRQFL